jgi:hypothetical protein
VECDALTSHLQFYTWQLGSDIAWHVRNGWTLVKYDLRAPELRSGFRRRPLTRGAEHGPALQLVTFRSTHTTFVIYCCSDAVTYCFVPQPVADPHSVRLCMNLHLTVACAEGR